MTSERGSENNAARGWEDPRCLFVVLGEEGEMMLFRFGRWERKNIVLRVSDFDLNRVYQFPISCVEFYDSNRSYLDNTMLHHDYLYRIWRQIVRWKKLLNGYGVPMFLVQLPNLPKENWHIETMADTLGESPHASMTVASTGEYTDLHELAKGWKSAIARARDPATR